MSRDGLPFQGDARCSSKPSHRTRFIFSWSGVLGVSIEDSAGQERMVGRLGPGEIVGEMGCITGRSRTATVRALRSSELLAISWCDLERIAMNDPAILLSICRTLVERLVQSQMGRAPGFHPHTFVLTSVGDSVDLHAFAQCFKEALTVIGETFLVRRDDCENMTAHELFQLERSHRYLIYVTEPDSPIWSKLCLRQADTVVLVAKGDGSPQPMPEFRSSTNIPLVLVLTWQPHIQPANTIRWIKTTGVTRQFHIRRASDVQRVARLLTGRGIGLVLSGGGARGLAHLGVVRALRENGIDIDIVMGTRVRTH